MLQADNAFSMLTQFLRCLRATSHFLRTIQVKYPAVFLASYKHPANRAVYFWSSCATRHLGSALYPRGSNESGSSKGSKVPANAVIGEYFDCLLSYPALFSPSSGATPQFFAQHFYLLEFLHSISHSSSCIMFIRHAITALSLCAAALTAPT